MKKIIALMLLAFTFFGNNVSASPVIRSKGFKINFTDKDDAKSKATWSEDKINITKDSLGWDGDQKLYYRESWIQTTPFAIGFSFRPVHDLHVVVKILPELEPVVLLNTSSDTVGNMFVRYSPDGKHWSSWQAMDYHRPGPHLPDEINGKFTAFVVVPKRERKEYIRYMEKYQKLDVPWVSDEEALVKWIIKEDPKFFDKHIPFAGYLQFLYEGPLRRGKRITQFCAVAYDMPNGRYQMPKNRIVLKKRYSTPWRFKAK
jgi:hypothetical protein